MHSNMETAQIVEQATLVLDLPESSILVEGMHALLERRILDLNAQILEITSRYQVSSVEEMEARYEEGSLSEIGSWEDFQRLDHLEYDRDRAEDLIQQINALRTSQAIPQLVP